MADPFDALGDPTRRRICELLALGEQPVGAIADALARVVPMSQPAVSQHLKVLRDHGLVQVRAEGTRRFYALDLAAVDAGRAWLDRLVHPIAGLAQPLDALATEVARGARARRSAPRASKTTRAG